jgi:hypothetical protein
MNPQLYADDMGLNSGTYPSNLDGTAPHHIARLTALPFSFFFFLAQDDPDQNHQDSDQSVARSEKSERLALLGDHARRGGVTQ